MKTHRTLSALLSAALLIFAIGCDSANPDDSLDADTNASEDVALSVSNLVSEDTGGLLDQMGDLFEMASVDGLEASAGKLAERVYDETTGTWTVSFTREHGLPDSLPYATISRVYEVQFLNGDGAPQQFFVTEGDTAYSINFTIVEGSGTLETPNLSAARTDITGQFVATGANTDEVTVNGTYSRSGAHTLTTENAVRTLDYDLSVEVIDLVGPRGSRRDLSQKISGTTHGTYQAQATFERGDLYHERDINRAVTILIDDGETTITVNGETFAAR